MMSYLKNTFNTHRRNKRILNLKEKYPQYEFGEGTYSSDLKVFDWHEGATLKIGAYCSIADGVQIFLGGEHNIDWVSTYPFNKFWKSARDLRGHPKTKGDVVIGSDVWVGREAMILSGVTIGHGAIVGARALVVTDVAPYSIVGGNPARKIKNRFDKTAIEQLLEIQWWNWEKSRIEKAIPLLMSEDIEAFLDAVEHDNI